MKVIDFRVRLRTPEMLKPWNPENPAPHFKQYIELYKMHSRLTEISNSEFVKNMHNQGVSKGVVCGGSIEDNDHLLKVSNSDVKENFFYIAGVHPKYGIKKIRLISKTSMCNINWNKPVNLGLLYPGKNVTQKDS